MVRGLMVLISIFLFFLFADAQERVIYDTSNVEVRQFNTAKVKEYKADSDFQYDLVLEPTTSLWDRFWSWFWSKV